MNTKIYLTCEVNKLAVAYLTDVFSYFFDVNSITCLRQFCERPMRKMLLYVFFVFVLIMKSKSFSKIKYLKKEGIFKPKDFFLKKKNYLRHERANCFCKQNLRSIWNRMDSSSFLVMLLLIF